MNENEFWSILDGYNNKISFSTVILENLSTLNEILEFDKMFKKHLELLYTFPVMESTFIINSYISDDEFKYFRAWLIAQGKEKFNMAIENIESIAEWLNKDNIDNIVDLGEDIIDSILDSYIALGGNENDFYTNTYPEKDINIEMNWADDYMEYKKRYPILVENYWNQERIEELH